MYSVVELAKMFNTTRSTIYNKLQTESVQEYIVKTKKGIRLEKEGLTKLQLLMSESKVVVETTDIQHQNIQIDNKFKDEYIESLKTQLEELKTDKVKLYEELNSKNNLLNQQQYQISDLINKNNLLLDKSTSKEKTKRPWWFIKK